MCKRKIKMIVAAALSLLLVITWIGGKLAYSYIYENFLAMREKSFI